LGIRQIYLLYVIITAIIAATMLVVQARKSCRYSTGLRPWIHSEEGKNYAPFIMRLTGNSSYEVATATKFLPEFPSTLEPTAQVFWRGADVLESVLFFGPFGEFFESLQSSLSIPARLCP